MITSSDNIEPFIPNLKPRLIFLGTMASICARTVDGINPKDAFFYHNNRNHFWKLLQLLEDHSKEPLTLSIEEKKTSLARWNFAITNIVQEIEVDRHEATDPSDSVLFKAHKNESLKFKTMTTELKQVIESTPLIFTCRHKRDIEKLVQGYFEFNGVDEKYLRDILYLPTPTRCSPRKRSIVW